MDGFTNPFLASIWSHDNGTSEKIYSEAGLDPPVLMPNGEEDAIVSSSLLVNNGETKLNAGLIEGVSGRELTEMPLPPLACPELFSSNSTMWAPSTFANSNASSFKGLGEFNDQSLNAFGNVQPESFNASALLSQQKGPNGKNGLNLTSLASGSQVSFTQAVQLPQQANTQLSSGTHQLNQLPATQAHATLVTATANGGFDGTFKPRVRARRGQATDPHSIAERLRREKISERMKNLQELVPNSNKTDKASMLDEIIDYVKFLQLQVKVLSMSRLGATEAVVPLLTDSQPEGSSGISSSVSVGSTASVSVDGTTSELQESAAFEHEVVRLMESNVTSAMQYLQNKGLCLMPIALASAISTQNGTHTATIPPPTQRQNSDSSSL